MFLGLCMSLAGCGHHAPPGPKLAEVHPVRGHIAFPNKTPLKGGMIYFTPVEEVIKGKVRYEAASLIDDGGNYILGFNGNNAGTAAGEYKVTIMPRGYNELPKSNSNLIPKKYHEQSSTPLVATVKDGDNTFDFVLN
jgi:hypothetical protein